MTKATATQHRFDLSMWMLYVAFAAVVASFFLSNLFVLRASSSVSEAAESIAKSSAPSTARLADIRRAALETEVALSRYIHENADPEGHRRALQAAIERTDRATAGYLVLPMSAGEETDKIQQGWLRFRDAVTTARELREQGHPAEATAAFDSQVEPARAELLDQVSLGIELNAIHASALAHQIHDVRRRSIMLSTALDVICGLLALLMAWLLHHTATSRRALRLEQTASLEERAAELEQFAGRVAHDCRNPLSSAQLATDLLLRSASDARTKDLATRVKRSLARADELSDALLAFARSGAKPDPGARTDVGEAVEEVVAEFRDDASRKGIALIVEPVPPAMVACSHGVYLSVLSNLVRNAIKYMGDSPVRRITIRVVEARQRGIVGTEVADSGPGISTEVLPSLFNPYVRGEAGRVEGLGLGLATVKRLTEAHGGAVGVRSKVGQGSMFWFELRHAGTRPAAHALEQQPAVESPTLH